MRPQTNQELGDQAMRAYDTLKEGLLKHRLEHLPGSIFDNAFRVFRQEPRAINLVVVGTNGNDSDREKSTLGWLEDRFSKPDYDHIREGAWGRTPLQSQLLEIPRCLNEVFGEQRFRDTCTVYTNALLLASSGVNDIGAKVAALRETAPHFRHKQEVIKVSMQFFADFLLKVTAPDLLFAYGNGDSDSAWAYITNHFELATPPSVVPIRSKRRYKFCLIRTQQKIIPVIGSPHLSYRYNKLNPTLIRLGLIEMGVISS